MKRTYTDTNLQLFLEWGHKTGWTQARLANEAMVGYAHLNQMLHGIRSGENTWRRILRVLPLEGISLLKRCSAWNHYAEAALKVREEREKLMELAAKCREPEPATLETK